MPKQMDRFPLSLILAPLGIIGLLALATNSEDLENGTNDGASKSILSASSGGGNNQSSPRSSSERVGIELEPIDVSRERVLPDAETEAKRQRRGSRGSFDEGSAKTDTRRGSPTCPLAPHSRRDSCELDDAQTR